MAITRIKRFLPIIGFSTLLICASAPATAAGEEIIAESRLTAATIYSNRATLTRKASVSLPAGASTITFNGLPASLLTDSLRSEGTGNAPVTFGALTHRQVPQTALAAPREQELTEQIEALEDRKKLVEAERQALASQRKFIESLGQQAGERASEAIAALRFDTAEWLEAATAIGSSVGEIIKADLALAGDIRTIDRALQKLRAELSQIRTDRRNFYTVSIPVEAAAPATLEVKLHYQVPHVSWRPVYDARLETSGGVLTLTQYGAVRQNTGEDWDNIHLTLSTAQPQRGASLPDLPPQWVDLYDPSQTLRARRGGSADHAVMSMASPAMESAPHAVMAEDNGGMRMEQAAFAAAAVNTDGFVTEYIIPATVNVKADGSESKVMIGTFDTENRMQIHVKPQISTHAYLVSRVTLQGDAPLLPGAVSLFRDGSYVGQSRLPLLRPGQEQDIGFGIDDQIAVNRHIIKDERSDPRLLSRENQLERHFATHIENRRRQDVDLVVLETTPAPRHDRIKVDILRNQTTQGYETDADDIKGLLRWQTPLQGQSETRVNLGWKITWPRDQELSGL